MSDLPLKPRRPPGPKKGTVPEHFKAFQWKPGESGGGKNTGRKRPLETAMRALLTGTEHEINRIPPRVRELVEAWLKMAMDEPAAMREILMRIDGAPVQDQAELPEVHVTVVQGGVQRPTVAAPIRDLPPSTLATVGQDASTNGEEVVPTTAVVVTHVPRGPRVVDVDDE